MTRPYVATRLLALGPLTFAEFLEITGWQKTRAWNVLEDLIRQGIVQFTEMLGCRRRVYQLRESVNA